MKIVIYGLGKEALFVKRMIKASHQILGFTDSFAQIEWYDECRYYKIDELKDISYDYIVLALKGRKVSDTVRETLVEKYHIREECIVDFFEMYAEQKIDKVMQACVRKCDGVILGISHAALGINPRYLAGECRNLANGSEDIYYHYQVLKKCVASYGDKVENLKYVIVDLYDYTIFNYDASLSEQILFYWSHGGLMEDKHHFARNTHYSKSLEEEMKAKGYYSLVENKLRLLRKNLFDEKLIQKELQELYSTEEPIYLGYNDFPLETQFSSCISQEPQIPFNMHYMGEKRYPDTMQENIYWLEQTIKLLLEINQNIKIYFLLMPRYYKLEEYHNVLLQDYREEFERIINKFERAYGIKYLNMKNVDGISRNPHFYRDTAHLNYYGSIAFTNILNRIIC